MADKQSGIRPITQASSGLIYVPNAPARRILLMPVSPMRLIRMVIPACMGAITIDRPLPGAIYTDLVETAIKEMKVKAPLGHIKGLPLKEFKG
ncbi:MAG: hypothetical protein M0Z70_13185 [Nitrospiraceae bacterium]|nr:hypothetical protein [Nitrospiraceae bacterium]